jgi:hypothetical protein
MYEFRQYKHGSLYMPVFVFTGPGYFVVCIPDCIGYLKYHISACVLNIFVAATT